MSDHEIYGRMAAAVKNIGGEVVESHYYNNGYMTVEGTLSDGRKISFWVEERKDEHRSES